MCDVVILLSTRELPRVDVDTTLWLGIEPLPSGYEGALERSMERSWVSSFRYLVVGHEGCGCAFHSDENCLGDDEDYNRQSRRALASYLRAQLVHEGTTIALYGVGGTSDPVEAIQVTTAHIARSFDPVPAGTYAIVVH